MASAQQQQELQNMITQRWANGTNPLDDNEFQELYSYIQSNGLAVSDLGAAARAVGMNIQDSDIQNYISTIPQTQNITQTGSAIPQAQANPTQSTQQTQETGGSLFGSGGGSGDGTVRSAAEWAQVAQSNSDYFTAVQNSIFQNPNITLADGSTQSTSFGNMPDYSRYVQGNQDILAQFNNQPEGQNIGDINSYGKWHWENHGQFEDGREMPTGSPTDLGFLQPEVNVNLSDAEQAIFDTNQRGRSALSAIGEQQLGKINQSFNQDGVQNDLYDPTQFMNADGLYEFKTDPSVEGFNQVRNDLIDRESYKFDRAKGDLENDLLVRGLDPGTEAWDRRFDDINRQENDFSLAATQYAGDVQNRLFDMEGTRRQQDISEKQLGYDLGRDWRANQITEDSYFRNQPLNEFNSLSTGSQIGLPGFTGYQGVGFQGPDYAGAEQETYNRRIYDQQRDDQKKAALFSGIGSVAGTALGGYAQGGGFNSGITSGVRGLFG